MGVIFLADIYDRFEASALGWTVLGIIGALTVFVLICLAKIYGRQAWGRTPPIDDQFAKHAKVLADLEKSLAGLAPQEKVDELVKQLGAFATQEQVRDIRELLPEFIKREELQRTLENLEKDIHAQMKEQREYVHKSVHDLRNDLQGMRTDSEHYREGVHNRLHSFAETLFELRGGVAEIREAVRRG